MFDPSKSNKVARIESRIIEGLAEEVNSVECHEYLGYSNEEVREIGVGIEKFLRILGMAYFVSAYRNRWTPTEFRISDYHLSPAASFAFGMGEASWVGIPIDVVYPFEEEESYLLCLDSKGKPVKLFLHDLQPLWAAVDPPSCLSIGKSGWLATNKKVAL